MRFNTPRHVAIIMDGNGRWAKLHRLNRLTGHRKGAETVRSVVTSCCEMGVEFLTLYAFSEENWGRPSREISALMKILKRFLISERKLLLENRVRLKTIGDISKLPKEVQKILQETMEMTRNHDRMILILALSYGGRDEITRAARNMARKVMRKELDLSMIDEETFSNHLDTAGLPDPDLVIRTSGEMRTSNFLPWQIAYSELYVTETLWPDFDRHELEKAFLSYSQRERRFGLTSEQVPKLRESAA